MKKWIIEVDHTASSNKAFSATIALGFAEAKRLADKISKQDDVYLVSLFRADKKLLHPSISDMDYSVPRAYIQRNGSKLHSAGSRYYRKWENEVFLSAGSLVHYPKFVWI